MYDVIIIGGGLAGLSSAVELTAVGTKILLLENRNFFGGRTYSFTEKKTGYPIDNGQHLMMGCYENTLKFLQTIGSAHLTYLQPNLHINYLMTANEKTCLNLPNLPPPFHLIGGILNFQAISFAERLKLFKVAPAILHTSKKKEKKLDAKTVDKWLNELGQSDIIRKYFWNVITLGALNNQPHDSSALMIFRVLRKVFLGNKKNSCLLIPKTDLSNLFVIPALKFITDNGGAYYTNENVQEIILTKDYVTKVKTKTGKEFSAKAFICAVPWHEAEKLLPFINIKGKFTSSPIISVNLWFDRLITNLDFCVLPNSKFHWMFNKTRLCVIPSDYAVSPGTQCLSLIMSSAQSYVNLSNKDLVEIAIGDLEELFPEMRSARLVNSLVIKERKATFLPYPGLEVFRPATETQLKNLFLAGDWTATGYPATIEGAILSGKKAAEKAKEFLSTACSTILVCK